MFSSEDLISHFNLAPHPEGGFFKESYRSSELIDTPSGSRNCATSIYFLLPEGKQSNFHRIKSDEVWHFYLGGPMTLYQLFENGTLEKVVLGQNVLRGELVQHIVPADCWFGGFPNCGAKYAFVGCTVAPGFDFRDFELAKEEHLVAKFPQHRELISQLTH